MQRGIRHFTFARSAFNEHIAHDGSAPILSSRPLHGPDGSPWSFIDLVRVPVGADIGIHTHTADNEEMYIIISGTGRMHVDGEEFEVGPGDVIVNAPGGTHGLVNTGNSDLTLVVVEVALAH